MDKKRVKLSSSEYLGVSSEEENPIKTIDDLINVARCNKRKRNSDYRKLKEMIPELEALRNLIGMKKIKTDITAQILFYLQDLGSDDMLHTVIEGFSGTGKTILAKIIGKIYLKLGFLTNDKFIIAKRSDLIGGYLGQTSINTQAMIDKANGGVLFIDEAYSLGNKRDGDSYSKECIDTIVSNLAERRTFVCIIAGYHQDLQDCFFSKNAGLARRFPWVYTIGKYTHDDLSQIFLKQLRDSEWNIDDDGISGEFFKDKMKYFDKMGGDTEILLAKCKTIHSRRVFGKPRYLKKIITKYDIEEGFKMFKSHKNVNDDQPPPWMYI